MDLLKARYVTHRFSRHVHDGYAIGVIMSGVEEFDYRGARHRAGTGSLVLVNPEHVHTGQAGEPGGWAYRMLYPSIEVMSGIAAELAAGRGTPHFPEPVVSHPHAAALLRAAHDAAEHGDGLASSTLARTAFGALLRHHAAHRTADARPAREDRAVRRAREILHERLVDPPTLEDLARAVQAKPFALIRAFKAVTGLPPHAYLNTLRVRRARGLLDSGTSAAQVATDVGFTDQAHLTRHFKRVVGVPPGAYQRAGTYKTASENRT
ncbi:AraC family transcriptional regulator [Streptosporangium roseum]|uniref:Transcriptional regulator, AraC family n=1 Tax=Streptosporangium roseum (strain ATCC 12428 / DSM 43021 / JCM 3005 / KCTC 9067 / NCIMB 10171 / NRRL 2505 / NI 9100) TaxID=479432 RepID=D2B853_STRRD|nr:AraC family transcriptional regulator [Streptosporangium roseum]ACZ85843.1 transcriptional regulator, AraC family [Streptosporangium roseum DSM 43021]